MPGQVYFVPKDKIEKECDFVKKVAQLIVGDWKSVNCPSERKDGRYVLHPASNDYWLRTPNDINQRYWRLNSRYGTNEELIQKLQECDFCIVEEN